MSDLAPFVAAAIRDKVVADLQEEIHELRRGLMSSRRVEIKLINYSNDYTPTGTVTHRGWGQLDDANLKVTANGFYDELHEIKLDTAGPTKMGDCKNIVLKVSVGGMELDDGCDRQSIPKDVVLAPSAPEDSDNSKVIRIYLDETQFCHCLVQGWPRATWEQFRPDYGLPPYDLPFVSARYTEFFKYMAESFPEATITFQTIGLNDYKHGEAFQNLRKRNAQDDGKQSGESQKRRRTMNENTISKLLWNLLPKFGGSGGIVSWWPWK